MRIPLNWPVWLSKQKYFAKNLEITEYDDENGQEVASNLPSATLISSETEAGAHLILLDLDIEHYYVPSSTPGHGHLYINKQLTKTDYTILLATLYHFGLIQKGYFRQILKHGRTTLRPPWVKKEKIPLPDEPPESF